MNVSNQTTCNTDCDSIATPEYLFKDFPRTKNIVKNYSDF